MMPLVIAAGPPLAANLWMIPAAPLAAAVITALLPKDNRKLASGLAIGAMIAALLGSCGMLYAALSNPGPHYFNFEWFDLGNSSLKLGLLLDPLTALMCTMVTFVGTLIFIFSSAYMHDDDRAKQFFCFLSLFAAAMLGLLAANSLLLLFICWELVGLASYLLIGFWFHKPSAAAAAKKAFITTRIGDIGFLLGLLWLNDATGSLLFYDGGRGVLETGALTALAAQTTIGGLAVSTAIGLLLFCGAIGKSGQFPLHVWLPDAMEGPTPVSALIHAATMVAAGVFLIARIFPLMEADKLLAAVPVHALTVVATIGAITALLGAFIAIGQNDLKRILAFSTVSQLGYMMLALGVGAPSAAIFHLLTHAFFKALLFLGAGSVIHAAHHEQDIRQLGGLSAKMKLTFATFAIGTMALVGVPLFFSGFWSKEAILHAAHGWQVSHFPFYAALLGVVLTAFYNTRLISEVFFGSARSPSAAHAHENSRVMTTPLAVLAFFAIALGFLGTPAYPWFQAKLSGEAAVHGHSLFDGVGLMALSVVLVALGVGAGFALYGRRPRTSATARDPLEQKFPALFAALAARLGFDELYAATVGRLNDALATFSDLLDRWVFDGVIRFLTRLGQFAGIVNRETDEELLNGGFDATSKSLRSSGEAYSRAQSGDAHGYLRVIAASFVLLLLAVLLGGVR